MHAPPERKGMQTDNHTTAVVQQRVLALTDRNLKKKKLDIYWHTMFSTFVPLLAALLDSGTCQAFKPQDGTGQCYPSTLRMLFAPSEMIKQQLSMIPDLKYKVVQPAALLEKPVSLVGPRQDPCHSERCANGSVMRKARRVLGPICGLDFDALKRRNSSDGWPVRDRRRALVIFRCTSAASGTMPHPHRYMCLNASSAFGALRANFDRLGFSTRGLFMDTLPMCEQLAVVASADVIIHGHGSFLANLIGATPATSVIELTPYVQALPKRTRDWCAVCAKANASSRWPVACSDSRPPKYALPSSRRQSRFIVEGLNATGVPMQHLALPAGLLPGGSRTSPWGCLGPARLAQLAAAVHERAVSQPQWRRPMDL